MHQRYRYIDTQNRQDNGPVAQAVPLLVTVAQKASLPATTNIFLRFCCRDTSVKTYIPSCVDLQIVSKSLHTRSSIQIDSYTLGLISYRTCVTAAL